MKDKIVNRLPNEMAVKNKTKKFILQYEIVKDPDTLKKLKEEGVELPYKYGTSVRIKGYNTDGINNLDIVGYPILLCGIDQNGREILTHTDFDRVFLINLANGIIRLNGPIVVEYIEGKLDLYSETLDKSIKVTWINELGEYAGVRTNPDGTVKVLYEYSEDLTVEDIVEHLFSDLDSYSNNIRTMLIQYFNVYPDGLKSWSDWFKGK